MGKPENPFTPRSMIWALMEEDWSDLTLRQIAEVFDSSAMSVKASIAVIKKKTGYSVPYTQAHSGVPKGRSTGPRSELGRQHIQEGVKRREEKRREVLGSSKGG